MAKVKVEKVTVLAPEVAATVEAEVAARLLARVAELRAPAYIPYPSVETKGERWRLSSALQKAIRRGDHELAQAFARALHDYAPWYLRRRLAIMAMEDKCAACPEVVAEVLFWCKYSPALPAPFGVGVQDLRVLLALVDGLSHGAKDRTACDLIVGVQNSPNAATADPETVFGRAVALRRIRMEQGNPAYFASHVAVDAPSQETVWSIETAFSFGEEAAGLASMLGLAYLAAARGCGECTQDDREPTGALIKHIPSYAYDQHVYEGKRAITYFVKAVPHFGKFLSEHGVPEENWEKAAGMALFRAEGHVVDDRLNFPERDRIMRESCLGYSVYAGVPMEAYDRAVEIVRANLGMMRHARGRVMGTTARGSGPKVVL